MATSEGCHAFSINFRCLARRWELFLKIYMIWAQPPAQPTLAYIHPKPSAGLPAAKLMLAPMDKPPGMIDIRAAVATQLLDRLQPLDWHVPSTRYPAGGLGMTLGSHEVPVGKVLLGHPAAKLELIRPDLAHHQKVAEITPIIEAGVGAPDRIRHQLRVGVLTAFDVDLESTQLEVKVIDLLKRPVQRLARPQAIILADDDLAEPAIQKDIRIFRV